MEVEFTARKVRISKVLRTQAEEGLQRIARMLGKTASASVTFSAQKHIQIAEVTIKARQQTIAAAGKGDTLVVALRLALEHAENQVRRRRDRRLESKRLPKEEKVLTAPPVARPKARAAPADEDAEGQKPVRGKAKARATIAVHSFPARTEVVEPHIIKSSEAVALKPMDIDEAVKEVEFRDRDLLVFRTPFGDLYVLHRRRDGNIELLEIP
jgi:putative sigma-54 modulation protein